jgi:hypothetical protein
MDKFLAQFSKNTLAVVAIAAGTLFIILNSPPRSVCDAQMNQIRESQKLFLFKETAKKGVKVKYICYRKKESLVPLKDDRTEEEYACSKYQSLRDRCKRTNDPGGCYELFQGIKVLLTDLSTLTRECSEAASSIDEVKAALKETLDLMVRLAWGEKPPSAYNAKFGWLDTADLSLFCKLKARYQNTYGEEAWNRYRQKLLEDLPGAKELARNEVWDLSIFSENCSRYP